MRNHQRILLAFCLSLIAFAINASGQKPELVVETGYSGFVVFSPDSKLLADGTDIIKLLDVASGKQLRTLTGHSGSVALTRLQF